MKIALVPCALALCVGLAACSSASSTPPLAPPPAVPSAAPKKAAAPAVRSGTPPAHDTDLNAVLKKGGLAAVKRKFGEPSAVFAESPEGENNLCELPDGTQLSFEWGFTESKDPLVITHSVSNPSTSSASYIRAVVDGTTTVAELNAYLSNASGGAWTPVVPQYSGPWIRTYLWVFPRGSGFVVKDYSAWSRADFVKYNGDEGTKLYGYTWGPERLLERENTGG